MTTAVVAPVPVVPRAHYEFDRDFQTKIVALALRDATFCKRTEGLIQPEYLELDADAAFIRLANHHWRVYKAPVAGVVKRVIIRAVEEKKIRKELAREMILRLNNLMSADLADREFVIEEVSTFARHQALELAIHESVDALAKRDFDTIRDRINKALLVGAALDGGTYAYFDEIENRTQRRIDLVTGIAAPRGISTGYADIDRHLYHQGWGRKELSVIMGAAKAGKSMSLGDFGISAALLGHNVLYVTLEVASEVIADRIDANLSDTAIMALKDTPLAVKEKILKARARAGKFNLEEFPSGSLRPSDLRRLLQHHRARGLVYDLIIVDYADIMAPERWTDRPTENSRTIYTDLRAIAFEENAAVLTATQTNREGAKKHTAEGTDVAEDFNKVRIADVLLSINATSEEILVGECRLYFANVRNSASGIHLRLKQDRAKMKFVTAVIGKGS